MTKSDTVQARYLGDTPQVFPHLADTDREAAAYEKWEASTSTSRGLNPRCYVVKGDVIEIDRASAEGRSDLEVVTKAAHKSTEKE
jgi:hypothetical protein